MVGLVYGVDGLACKAQRALGLGRADKGCLREQGYGSVSCFRWGTGV